ncbi:MAG: serine/threonine-protein kinase PknK, partial [Oscillatoria sp. PMC 1076.18]|nr:serine/threonine-protein kinase PknK [Oscillatoria sp. PMC 1076.18]
MTSTLLSEKIYESARTVVYRGKKVANGEPIIIKLMRNEYPSFRELVQFRNQYAIAKNLDLEGIVKCYGLERYDNRYALIMEDTGSISLAAYKQQQSLLSLRQFLDLAIQLSEIVHQLHNNSIIHKDIKPANILINPETKQIKLIDFSISTLLPKETQTLQTPNVLEGTLAYIAPEQTGRMNRGIDYRSDFYSLGVTFYELLAGALPFPTDDPLELIHAHLAQNPEPISEYICLGGDICPEPLADIVKKLMAKNAEDRYQSALGIKYDLEKCREQWEETGEIKPFELGERDLCDRFLIPEQLYGRETEVQTLLDVFERVAEGRSEMMLVAGFSGIGKTAVVNEVHKPIVRQRGYFIKGKFDQFNRNIPFSAFVQALRDLMGQLLSESDEQLARWRSQILTVVGDNGQVLLEMIPELESVIGKQPPVLELSGSAAQNRFNLLFEKFISVLTTKEHPLVIFLDDLQWADSASLNLMKVLMGDRDRGYLLLLGAYRDHEVFPAHPLLLTLRKLAQQEAAISTITLSPLSVDRVNQLVAETLSCTLEQAQPLTELVYQKTQGNPFFTTQFLKGLYQDELIVFNRTLGYWECDLVKVRDAALTDDVVEFMASRLQKLPEATQEVLKLAACIGNEFDLETLAVVCETTLEEVASELWSGLQEGVVVPISQAYKFFQSQIDSASFETVTVNYRFLHDRVQQAAYSLIAEAKKTQTHLKIGQLLWQHTDETQKDEKIFAIVNQFNYGLELINNDFERLQVAQLNAIAGHKAKVSTAYAAARQYLSTGINLLPTNSWQSEYQLTLNLYQEAVEAAYLNADFEQMEYLSQEVLKSAQTLLEKIKVYEVKIQAATAQNQMSTAIQTARLVLSFLGVEFPESPTSLDRERAMAKTASKLSGKNIEDLTDLPVMTDPEKLAMMKVLATVASAAYIGMPELYPLIVLKQVDISLEYGNTASSAYAYATYGLILCAFAEDIPGGSRSGELALQLLEKFQAKEYQAKILNLVHPFVRHWTSPLKDSLPSLLEGYQSGIETGDLEFAAYCIFNYCTFEYYSGNELSNLAAEMATYGQAIQQIEQQTALNFHNIIRQSVLNLLGKNNHPCLLVGNIYDENVMLPRHLEANDLYAVGSLYVSKLILNYLLDNNFEVVLE